MEKAKRIILTFEDLKVSDQLETVADNPFQAVGQVFSLTTLSAFRTDLFNWLEISTDYIYEEPLLRTVLVHFHNRLQELIQVLHALCFPESEQDSCIEIDFRKAKKANIPANLTRKQLSQPFDFLESFFDEFSIVYIRHELKDWIKADLYYTGPWPENTRPFSLFLLYDDVLCLTEAAWVIHQNKQMK